MFVPNCFLKEKKRRVSSKKFLEFEVKLRLDPNKYSFDEQDIISTLQVAFEGEIMHTQYCVQNKRLDCCFPKDKIGIEIDEYGHADRNVQDEKSRTLIIEEKIGCIINRIDPDTADFNIYRIMNQVRIHIK